jgi:hypothetical protein
LGKKTQKNNNNKKNPKKLINKNKTTGLGLKKTGFFPTLKGVPRGRHARRHQGHAGGSARQQD